MKIYYHQDKRHFDKRQPLRSVQRGLLKIASAVVQNIFHYTVVDLCNPIWWNDASGKFLFPLLFSRAISSELMETLETLFRKFSHQKGRHGWARKFHKTVLLLSLDYSIQTATRRIIVASYLLITFMKKMTNNLATFFWLAFYHKSEQLEK